MGGIKKWASLATVMLVSMTLEDSRVPNPLVPYSISSPSISAAPGFWEAGGGREKGRPIEAAGEAEGHCGAGRDVGFWWEK